MESALLLIVSIGAVIALIAALLIVIALMLANLGWWFTQIEKGSTVFINKGDDMKAIWPNVGGYKMSKMEDPDGRRWLIKAVNEKDVEESFFFDKELSKPIHIYLWKKFGVRFMGIFWPQVHRHSFKIDRKRLREATGSDGKLGSRVAQSPNAGVPVDSLLFLVPRPIHIEGVELAGDNSKISLLLLPIFQQVIPSLPVYYYKGDFFTPLDGAIEAAMVNFFAVHRVAVIRSKGEKGQEDNEEFAHDTYDPSDYKRQGCDTEEQYREKYEPSPLTYHYWIRISKTEGSPMEQHLRSLNATREYHEKLKGDKKTNELVKHLDFLTHDMYGGTQSEKDEKGGKEKPKPPKGSPSGIIPRFGFALVSLRLVDWTAHGDTEELSRAILQKQTESHRAKGVREKAYGERDAVKARGEGENVRFNQMVRAYTDQGVDPNVAAQIVGIYLRTENIGGSTIGTYVEGGSNVSVMVPANGNKANAKGPGSKTETQSAAESPDI